MDALARFIFGQYLHIFDDSIKINWTLRISQIYRSTNFKEINGKIRSFFHYQTKKKRRIRSEKYGK